MARSELGREVTVDLQANAYFNENGGGPTHELLLSFKRSLCCGFGQDQPLGACPSQSVVRGSSSGARGPAALLDEFSLFPAQRDGFQGNQVRRRIGVVLEFLHTDRREGSHDSFIGALIRKLAGGVTGHPTAPVESDARENNCSTDCAPTSRFHRGRNSHGFRLSGKRTCTENSARCRMPVLSVPAPRTPLLGVISCPPMAPALPIESNGDFGASPSYGSSRTSHCLPVN